MRFLCDAMLGRLATWLRILGYDTVYANTADDHALARQARAEGRILLTRDTQLVQRRGIRALLITSDELEEQIRQVLTEFGLKPQALLSRCPVCNTPLRPLPRERAQARVPPYVFQTQASFHECPTCERVYWPGSHWARIRQRLDALDVSGGSEA